MNIFNARQVAKRPNKHCAFTICIGIGYKIALIFISDIYGSMI